MCLRLTVMGQRWPQRGSRKLRVNNNTEALYIHTRLTVNGVFKIFSEERRLTA